MKILSLIIRQKYFDAILAGRKVQEFREVRPTTIKKLLQLDEDGYEIEDEHGNAQPIKYDAIQFYVGYGKDRDSALVEVLGAHCEIFVDENDEPITYEYGKDKDGEPLVWVAEQVVFDLGKILSRNIRGKSKKV
ncbi:ASCH domain-containing protein [Bacteroides heparinolyticus]|uniref:ASCH domain-containing protein n=1 Tax=Prevotella heparinolytica TaxID=28113 RepID=UPI0023EF61E2|nr:ASCH domain-containing protein [Bacteroides heparinolyticus]